MTLALQILGLLALASFLVALYGYILPLLIQARKAATALEQLSQGIQTELQKTSHSLDRLSRQVGGNLEDITEDIRETRLQISQLAELFKLNLGQNGILSEVVSGTVKAIPSFFGKQERKPTVMENLMAALPVVLSFLGPLTAGRNQGGAK